MPGADAEPSLLTPSRARFSDSTMLRWLYVSAASSSDALGASQSSGPPCGGGVMSTTSLGRSGGGAGEAFGCGQPVTASSRNKDANRIFILLVSDRLHRVVL